MKRRSYEDTETDTSIVLTIATLLLLVLDIPVTAAGTKKVDVLFTHDTHSHLDSFSTIVDGQQKEVGGFAKIKTLMDEKKKDNPDTLVLDGGDFSMGTLIQTVYDAEAAELRMLGYLGYDDYFLEITNTTTGQRDWQIC